MAWIGSFYLIGLFAASFFGYDVDLAAAAVVILFAVSALVVYGREHMKVCVCMFSMALGLFLHGVYDICVYQNIIKYDGCGIEMEGIVTDLSEYSGDKSSYTVKGMINGSVKATVTFYGDSSFAETGDKVTFSGKAEVLKDSFTFPAESYCKAKGIYLRINDVSDFKYEPAGSSLRKTVNRYRERILNTVYNEMDRECAAIMTAMLFGDKSSIDSDEKTLMYRAGIGHIMAVSGVHLSVVCSFFGFILSRLPINKYLRFAIFLVPILCFVLLAGMTNSVVRSAVMVILVYGAGIFRRRADTFNSLGIAVILLTAFSPFAVRDASFLLSAAGVFGIGVAAPALMQAEGLRGQYERLRRPLRSGVFQNSNGGFEIAHSIKKMEKLRPLGKIAKSVISSFCVMTVVFPVTLLFFDEVSVISPLSNLLLLPICEVILIGGIIVTVTGGLPLVAVPVLKVCGICCRAVIIVSEFIGRLRFSYLPLGSGFVRAAVIAAVVVSIFMVAAFRKKSAAVGISVLIMAAVMAAANIYKVIPDGKITVAVIKDDSAVTAVIHDKSSACIIDLNKGGLAADPVVKYLNKIGIYKINALVLNADANSSLAAYNDALKLFDVEGIFVPEEDINILGGYSNSNIRYYRKNGGCLKTEHYSAEFLPDGVVVISASGTDIIMYGGDSELDGDAEYNAAVRYSGTKRDSDANADTVAAMNDKASVAADKNTKVYIGENVRFVISENGEFTSEVLQ